MDTTRPLETFTPARLATERVFHSLDKLLDSEWETSCLVRRELAELALGLLDASGMLPGYESPPVRPERVKQVLGGIRGGMRAVDVNGTEGMKKIARLGGMSKSQKASSGQRR